MKMYFPATCDIVTPGHIECLEWLREYQGQNNPIIIIGLLTDAALKGYKEPVMPFKDRLKIMETIANGIRNRFGHTCCMVVPQRSLDPTNNLRKYKPGVIASGDGWEPIELEAAEKTGCKAINIRLPGENKKKYSSSKIKALLKEGLGKEQGP